MRTNETIKSNDSHFEQIIFLDFILHHPSFQSIIHVSTAFCNPNQQNVEEMVYPPKLQIDVDTFMKCVNILPGNVAADIALSLQVNKAFH